MTEYFVGALLICPMYKVQETDFRNIINKNKTIYCWIYAIHFFRRYIFFRDCASNYEINSAAIDFTPRGLQIFFKL